MGTPGKSKPFGRLQWRSIEDDPSCFTQMGRGPRSPPRWALRRGLSGGPRRGGVLPPPSSLCHPPPDRLTGPPVCSFFCILAAETSAWHCCFKMFLKLFTVLYFNFIILISGLRKRWETGRGEGGGCCFFYLIYACKYSRTSTKYQDLITGNPASPLSVPSRADCHRFQLTRADPAERSPLTPRINPQRVTGSYKNTSD